MDMDDMNDMNDRYALILFYFFLSLFSKRPSPLATFGVTSVESQDASASSDPVAPGTNDLVFYWSCASGTGTFNCRTLSNFGPGTWILQSLSFEFVT